MLYTTPVPENEKKLKSPEQLKGYVIVKVIWSLNQGIPDDKNSLIVMT